MATIIGSAPLSVGVGAPSHACSRGGCPPRTSESPIVPHSSGLAFPPANRASTGAIVHVRAPSGGSALQSKGESKGGGAPQGYDSVPLWLTPSLSPLSPLGCRQYRPLSTGPTARLSSQPLEAKVLQAKAIFTIAIRLLRLPVPCASFTAVRVFFFTSFLTLGYRSPVHVAGGPGVPCLPRAIDHTRRRVGLSFDLTCVAAARTSSIYRDHWLPTYPES